MTMYHIRAEGLVFCYATRDDILNREIKPPFIIPEMSRYMQERLPALLNVRLVVIPHPLQPDQAEIYYMHWRDSESLDWLDRKVQSGSYTDEDFAPSVLTRYQRTSCRKCGSRWHTLVVPPDTYIGLGDLHKKKMESRWKDVKSCPSCKASFGQIVLEILGTADA